MVYIRVRRKNTIRMNAEKFNGIYNSTFKENKHTLCDEGCKLKIKIVHGEEKVIKNEMSTPN